VLLSNSGGQMALTKKDLEKIGEVVDEKVTREIGSLRLEMNQRFDMADEKNTKEHQEILEKIEQVKQMETEDIEVLYTDVVKIKKKVGIA